MTKQGYISTYWQAAQDACAGTNIRPILALAESACESSWGESQLAKEGNNLFGVKAYPQYWTGETVTMHTKEFHPDGTPYYIDAPFKKYGSAQESFADWIKTISGPRYQAAGIADATTAEMEIEDIAKAGYSTSPTYAATIISIIRGLQSLLPA